MPLHVSLAQGRSSQMDMASLYLSGALDRPANPNMSMMIHARAVIGMAQNKRGFA
ncbi:MAG: hypothetical protein V4673_15970 [Pseudomonadota bacterium]